MINESEIVTIDLTAYGSEGDDSDHEMDDERALVVTPPATGRVEIHHNFRTFRPFERDPSWPMNGLPNVGQREALARGMIYEDGELLEHDSRRRERIVKRLSGDFDDMPKMFDPTAAEWDVRPYVPGLMNFGTVPAFVAPKGWGKTTFLTEFVTALIVPGHRLLDHFEPVKLRPEDRARDVWLINTEVHPRVIHDFLLNAGLVEDRSGGNFCYRAPGAGPEVGVLFVEHLVVTTPTAFDLTDEVKYDYWVTRLTEFIQHRRPPLTVIADGITAILGAQTTRYGAFTSKFIDLLRECSIPNGLGVLHSPMGINTNTPMNGVESMGQWDGLWIGSANAFPLRRSDRRYFETLPRMGDPEVSIGEIVVSDVFDKPRFLPTSRPKPTPEAAAEAQGPKQRVLARLTEAGPEGLWTKEACGEGDEYSPDRAAIDALVVDKKVTFEKVSNGRSRGIRWRVTGVQ